MKNLLLLLLTSLIAVSSSPVFAQGNLNSANIPPTAINQPIQTYISKASFPISAIDPTPDTNPVGRYYPGVRGANQLIIYTSKFGAKTDTNEFGQEASVFGDTVTQITGSDSYINGNGFVISGHGAAKNWINKNIIIGTKIRILPSKGVIEAYTIPDSYTFKVQRKIEEISTIINEQKRFDSNYTAENSMKYLQSATMKLGQVKEFMFQNKYNEVKRVAEEASKDADKALYYAIPPKAGELKGVWVRPIEKNAAEISMTLDRIKNSGINEVFLETYYHGYTIFPSSTLASYGVKNQRSEFQGWDPLKIWIEEAHKRKMKVHAWFQTFYVGNENISKNPKHVLSAYPQWANVQKKNFAAEAPMYSTAEHNGYFLDPANPDVQRYLYCLLSEIVNNYDVDGLNIDYIRYPVSLTSKFPNYIESTWGYSKYARNEFKQLYFVDPVELTDANPEWCEWIRYRQNKVNEFVSKLKSLKSTKDFTISTVIFPDYDKSSVVKLQDWQCWASQGYVDAFTPLILGDDCNLAALYMSEMKYRTNNRVFIYPGVFQAFVNSSPVEMLKQVITLRKTFANGVIIFDYAHLNDEFKDALTARAFNKD